MHRIIYYPRAVKVAIAKDGTCNPYDECIVVARGNEAAGNQKSRHSGHAREALSRSSNDSNTNRPGQCGVCVRTPPHTDVPFSEESCG